MEQRVINIKFPLQPHQKYHITQYEELGFSYLYSDERLLYSTNSPNLIYTILLSKRSRIRYFLNLGVEGLSHPWMEELPEGEFTVACSNSTTSLAQVLNDCGGLFYGMEEDESWNCGRIQGFLHVKWQKGWYYRFKSETSDQFWFLSMSTCMPNPPRALNLILIEP